MRRLGPRATLELVDGADHSFGVPKRSGRTAADIMDQLAASIASWSRIASAEPMSYQPTAQQRRAIEAPLGPLLVVAGPGAGKTYCLIYRIQHLIQKLDIPPRRILAVTFTNKAAGEIASRLHDTRGSLAAEITRGTLHATCLMILRDFAERCGLRSGFGVADREYQEQVLRRLRIPQKRCAQAWDSSVCIGCKESR